MSGGGSGEKTVISRMYEICILFFQDLKRGSGGSIYWNLMSKTFLKKLLPSHTDDRDVVCNK